MEHQTKLQPECVFHYFAEVCKIPRPSKKEEKMIAFLKDFGEKHGLETKVDKAGNVLISDVNSVYTTLTCAKLPIDACTAFGLKASAVPSPQNTVDMPNQCAMRMIVPKLPGSCIRSSARQSSCEHIFGETIAMGNGNIASTCCGCCKKLTRFNSSFVVIISVCRGLMPAF